MKSFKGELKGFPEEVVEKMLERQVEAGNKRDVKVFENDKSEGGGGRTGLGFHWYSSLEEESFWRSVIADEDFSVFFKKYPKQNKEVNYEIY